jgi:signal transduction histidine kinase
MLGISDARDPLLINTVGHSVGFLLFSVLVVLLIADWRRKGIRQTGLTLTAASLALLWNLGSLMVLASSRTPGPTLDTLVTFSFSVLSILPAVLLNVVLQGKKKLLLVTGYAVSVAAIALHFYEIDLSEGRLHQWGIYAVSVGFGILLTLAIVLTIRSEVAGRARSGRLVSLICLLCFSLSFLHFGNHHPAAAWTAEIAWHHASIPLVLFVLLQDYRFLFLDVFFQFLFNFGLAAVFVASAFFGVEHFHLWEVFSQDGFRSGLGIVLLCLSVIVFAYLRRALQGRLTAALFRRTIFETYAQLLGRSLATAQDEKQMLQLASANFGEYMEARQSAVESMADAPLQGRPFVAGSSSRSLFSSQSSWAQVVVPIRLFRGDSYCILLGSRQGGRRYLSQDLDVLQRLSAIVVDKVERFRHQSLERLVAQAELRALQSQINPHFLFNALNTLYGTIDRSSQQARQMVLNLAELFRYVLNTDRQFIRLEEELRIVRAYLDIEKLRLGDRLEISWAVSESSKAVSIPVLSIQPIVENAVKHGVAAKKGRGVVRVIVESFPDRIWIRVEDTGPGFSRPQTQEAGTGVGLENVRQRLVLCYGKATEFNIQSSQNGSTVSFFVPIMTPGQPPPTVAESSLDVPSRPLAAQLPGSTLV